MSVYRVDKPQVAILSPPLFLHPARNFMASVLYRDIQALRPEKALDAGAGKLKTMGLFPAGSYTALAIDGPAMEQGLRALPDAVVQKVQPDILVRDLNQDFHEIGPFDLVVCTGTTSYLDHPFDVLKRLAQLLTEGGSLLFDIEIRHLAGLLDCGLEQLFERVSYFPYDCLSISSSPAAIASEILGAKVARSELNDFDIDLTPDMCLRLGQLTSEEMKTPCPAEDARSLYVNCRGRKTGYAAMSGAPPAAA